MWNLEWNVYALNIFAVILFWNIWFKTNVHVCKSYYVYVNAFNNISPVCVFQVHIWKPWFPSGLNHHEQFTVYKENQREWHQENVRLAIKKYISCNLTNPSFLPGTNSDQFFIRPKWNFGCIVVWHSFVCPSVHPFPTSCPLNILKNLWVTVMILGRKIVHGQ